MTAFLFSLYFQELTERFKIQPPENFLKTTNLLPGQNHETRGYHQEDPPARSAVKVSESGSLRGGR